MALLAESLVEEWLNREGYFTIRGVKHGVGEMDLLAVRPQGFCSRRGADPVSVRKVADPQRFIFHSLHLLAKERWMWTSTVPANPV